MTPNQLPPLPEPDSYQFQHDETGQTMFVDRQQVEWGFEANNPRLHKIGGAFAADQMRSYALAALAQQEPVAAALGDIVALWDKYAPSEYMVAIHMQAKRALAGQQPVSPDMHRWCAYVGGMVASWVTSEPDAHARLGDDKFDAAIAGIIERRLWAMPTRDTTPPAPQPAPVDERAEFEESMREKHGWVARDFQSDSFGYFDGHTATAWLAWQARAALQSPAPQTKGGEA